MKMKTEVKIIQQTIAVIDDEGYKTLSLRKLTKSLNLTTGAFYKHFLSKEDLFQQTAQQLSKDFIQSVNLNDTDSAETQLLQIADKFCREIKLHPQRMDFLFFNPAINFVYSNQGTSQFQFLEKVKSLIKEIDPSREQELFLQIWSFIQGYAYLINNNVTNYDANLVKRTLKEFVGRGNSNE